MMATKSLQFSLENKQNTLIDGFSNEYRKNDQYNSINLNQNLKHNDFKGAKSFSKSSEDKRNDYAFSNVTDFAGKKDADLSARKNQNFLKKNDISKSHENLCYVREGKEELKLNSGKNDSSKSTLSLHIEAYENSIEAQNSDDKSDDRSTENKSQKKAFCGRLNDAKSRFSCSSATPPPKKDKFGFARQQCEDPREAEEMKFKASQKLLNPEETNSKGKKKPSILFKKIFDQTAKHVGNAAKDLSYVNQRFLIKFPPARGVNVFDKTTKTLKGKAAGLFRVDVPHNGTPFHHININPKVSGIPDPHIKISPSQFAAAKTAGKVLDTVNKVAAPVAIAIDTARVGIAAYEDVKNKTTRNIVETGASIVGGWGGGYGGGAMGAAIGTLIFPGVGTFAGAIIGGIGGGIGGSIGAEKASEAIGNKLNYNVVKRKCRGCQKMFKVKLYKDEKNQLLCKDCIMILLY